MPSPMRRAALLLAVRASRACRSAELAVPEAAGLSAWRASPQLEGETRFRLRVLGRLALGSRVVSEVERLHWPPQALLGSPPRPHVITPERQGWIDLPQKRQGRGLPRPARRRGRTGAPEGARGRALGRRGNSTDHGLPLSAGPGGVRSGRGRPVHRSGRRHRRRLAGHHGGWRRGTRQRRPGCPAA